MFSPLIWLVALGPLAAAMAGLAPRYALRLARPAATLTFAIAIATAACVTLKGTLATGTVGFRGVGFALLLDPLSATMLVLVSFIGLVVVAYSRNYMAGDPGEVRFTRRLCLTLAAVLLLIISGNLLLCALAWIATSFGLHGLLVFYRDRPAAVLAARKKFLASRLGDFCLVAAMAMIHSSFGTLDYQAIFSRAATTDAAVGTSPAIQAACVLLAAAALLRSAQFPLHGWLIEVTETPTPVSALLHAGIVNAGGYLVLRLAGLIALSTPALDTLALVGGFTAFFGSLVMLPQTSIKVSLAWSTIAQMGFMMLECGMGAFSAAFLHIVAHSLYKAHAFLSSGRVIDIAPAARAQTPGAALPVGFMIATAAIFAVGIGLMATRAVQPGVAVLAAVVILGVMQLAAGAIDARSPGVAGRTIGLGIMVVAAYCGLQSGAESMLWGVLPRFNARHGNGEFLIASATLAMFAGLAIFQRLLPAHGGTLRWRGLHVHVSQGFYVNTLINRWILRLWPNPPRLAAGAR